MSDSHKTKELEEKLFQLSLENQSLKRKIDLLQMWLQIYNAPPMFHSHPIKFGTKTYQAGQRANSLPKSQEPSTYNLGHRVFHSTTGHHAIHTSNQALKAPEAHNPESDNGMVF